MPENRHISGFRGPSPDVGKSTRFQPGQSGNPGGRPKSKRLTDAYRAILGELVPGDPEGRTFAEVIALAQVREAIKGNTQAAAEIADRTEGKPRQQATTSGGFEINRENVEERLRALVAKVRARRADERQRERRTRNAGGAATENGIGLAKPA